MRRQRVEAGSAPRWGDAEGPVWIAQSCLDVLVEDAQRYVPRETGGVLLGYRAECDLVVRFVVLGGPSAVRQHHAFRPDGPWQEREIARQYAASERVDSYLGDWHSHPDGGLVPSMKDLRTLGRIARSPEARASEPLMLLLAGPQDGRDLWCTTGWCYTDGGLEHRAIVPFG